MNYEYRDYEDDMILRDYLAYDRTKFALLRTFLSIARTALGLFASGFGLIIVKESPALISLGYVLCVFAVGVLIVGGIYSYRARKRLNGLNDGRS